jgi:hypothetical protein
MDGPLWWELVVQDDGRLNYEPQSVGFSNIVTLLTSREIWNERNAKVFHNKHAPPLILLDKIKKEARIWVKAGAKTLSDLVPGE